MVNQVLADLRRLDELLIYRLCPHHYIVRHNLDKIKDAPNLYFIFLFSYYSWSIPLYFPSDGYCYTIIQVIH